PRRGRGVDLVAPGALDAPDDRPPGTVFIWGAVYSPTPRFERSEESMQNRLQWRLIWSDTAAGDQTALSRIYLRVPPVRQ
ncbi:MAG: hypothetical protein GY778_30750, partial [bacterium]|nr:hypothetical protein [bacterium]